MTRFRTLSGRWLVMKKPSSQTKGLRWTDLLSAALGCIALATILACSALTAHAQQPDQETKPQPDQGAKSQKPDQEAPADPDPSIAAQDADPNPETLTTMFPHSDSTRYWISAQWNLILQWHPAFPAKYSGPNSMNPHGENATSHLETVYAGYELSKRTEVLFDLESAGGKGLSNALGLAGFTNLDVVRNPTLGDVPYLARLMLRQIIPLNKERVTVERGPLALATSLPARRLEFRLGKLTIPDFFDQNTYGTDSHLQFLNWTVDNDGAYDYAANTRGYTDGAILEYDDHWFSARFGVMLMPKVANGIFL